MRKCLSMALALVMCLSVLSITAFAADENVNLNVTVRDFKADKILFESDAPYGKITEMVKDTLGADKKSVY